MLKKFPSDKLNGAKNALLFLLRAPTHHSYSVTGDSLQYIYSVPVIKNHQNIRSKCLVHEFSCTDIFYRY